MGRMASTGHTKVRRIVETGGHGAHTRTAAKLGVSYSILRTVLTGRAPDIVFAFKARDTYGIQFEEWLDEWRPESVEWPASGPPDPDPLYEHEETP